MTICRYRVRVILLIMVLHVDCYEKTLRKMVRSQSKMVQRPFSEDDTRRAWSNASIPDRMAVRDALMFPGHSQSKAVIHKMQRPKMTIISSSDPGRSKLAYLNKGSRIDNLHPNELRSARNTINHTEADPKKRDIANQSHYGVAVNTHYEIPKQSKFFPVSEEQGATDEQQPKKPESVIIPEPHRPLNSSSLLVKGLFQAIQDLKVKPLKPASEATSPPPRVISAEEKLDFLIQGSVSSGSPVYSYNVSGNTYACSDLPETKGDIDTQEKFAEFNIEPPWMTKKTFWNQIFDSRYEVLMRNPKWPPLKVILMPRTHVDSIWRKTFARYHNDSVSKILTNVVKKLQFYSNLTFTWNEVSHLSQWWSTANSKSRNAYRRLVRSGRLEITTGGWVEPDEATTHLFGLVHLLIEGHQWLKNHLNYVPTVAWLTNSVTHSPTMAYLLSASGINHLVLTNLHYSWEEYLAEFQYSDFVWVQSWDRDRASPTLLNKILSRIGNDRYPKRSVLTHFLQFNSAGFKACGPNKEICSSEYNFAKTNRNIDIYPYNVKEKSELLLEQYSKTGTTSSHNIVIAPMGGPYHYELQAEFDYQYNNYQKIAEYVNMNREIYKATIEFGTPKDYFKAVLEQQASIPSLVGDFLNFADLKSGTPAYWTGFFTSRPLFKILLRRMQSTLRSTEILFSFAISLNAFRGTDAKYIYDLLISTRETVARLLDRNVGSGTLSANALRYSHKQILKTVKDCWYIQEVTASLISVKPGKSTTIPYLQKYVYRDGEFSSIFRTVSPGDQIYVFNSLSHERTEVIELTVRNPNIRIIDHNKKEVTLQLNPVWKYSSDNLFRLSRQFFKAIFVIVVAPMSLELYKIKETYDASQNAAAIYCVACIVDDMVGSGVFPFTVLPLEKGDIQLENYRHRLLFDEATGFLKYVVEKMTGLQKTVVLDYGAFKSSTVNSGMFLFNTNTTKPVRDVLMPYRIGDRSKIVMIISGQVTTELTSVYGKLLQSTVKIFNLLHGPLSNAIYVESKVDYEVSPKNRELEMFLSIRTDIGNGNPPEIFTDNNGFQYAARLLNISRRVESNMFPITTMAYMQDRKTRLSVITDHAQGVTALQEGQLVVMLDRRVLFNDGRGTNEGLADSSATSHRHYILLENLIESSYHYSMHNVLQLPSLSAIHLANSLNDILDVFVIDKSHSDLCYYTFLPLIKTSFPCDVAVVNFRAVFNRGNLQHHTPNVALIVLHRQSISCRIDFQPECNGDNSFSLEKILHNVRSVYQTNLCGTNKGAPVFNLHQGNFPSMELTTLRIQF